MTDLLCKYECVQQWLALYCGKKFHANRHVANWQDLLLLDPLEQ
jgi:hypothetical protein